MAWRESVFILLEFSPKDVDTPDIKNAIMQESPEVCDVHDVHVWVLTSNINFATLHVVIDDLPLSRSKALLEAIQKLLPQEKQ